MKRFLTSWLDQASQPMGHAYFMISQWALTNIHIRLSPTEQRNIPLPFFDIRYALKYLYISPEVYKLL
jgi:hypothetical protein